MRKITTYLSAITVAVGALAPVASQAQENFPNRPIKLVVPFAPGGGNDVFARLVAQKLSTDLPQQVVVENKPGAGGNIGSKYVASSKADGYTLLLGHTGTMSINPTLYANLGYDPREELTPVASIASTPLALVVNKNSPFTTLGDLLKKAKADPDSLNYASSGAGTGNHLAAVLMDQNAQVKTTHIPYRGTGPALADLLGGQVDFTFSVIPPVLGTLKAGQLRALAITGEKRSALLPDVPTMAEAGLPDTVSVLNYGILAPKETPESVISYLHEKIGAVLKDPEVIERFNKEGADVVVSSNEEYKKVLETDREKWAKVLKDADITL
ncbi:MAG TPA: tripartite tricarboxylate transporter substrate binding protein [Eoetvoesiella sp.]